VRILVTRKIHEDAVALLRRHFEVDYIHENRPLDPAYLVGHLHEFDGVLSTVSERLDGPLLSRRDSRIKAISNMAAGLDNVDIATAVARGIRVFNTPEATIDSTADMTVAIALTLIRQVIPAQRFIAEDQWRAWDPMIFQGRTLSGMTWGICGMGRIGRAVAKRVAAFGVSIAYFDPQVDSSSIDGHFQAQSVTFGDLLQFSDVISIHTPLTPQTRGLFCEDAFRAMKRGAFLVNMARGPLVDSTALLGALKKGWITGAAMDVFDPEPLPGGHEIIGMDNVVITPHIGTSTQECRREMAMRAAENLVQFFQGEQQ